MARELDVAGLASAYRRLVLWFGAQALVGILRFLAPPSVGSVGAGLLGAAHLLALWTVLLALALYGFRTAKALGSTVPWVWAVAMFVPLVNVATLLLLSARGTKACRANGIPVGLLGPEVPSSDAPSESSEELSPEA